ncbi:MAG: hypothetical protein PPP55_06840 [Halorubrum sp.]
MIVVSAALSERAAANGAHEGVETLDEWNRRLEACTDLYRGQACVWCEKRVAAEDGGGVVPVEPPDVEPNYHPLGARYEGSRSTRERYRTGRW